MTKIKNVVKVMNFHSLLRVDAAKKKAEKVFVLEKELKTMISHITNNENLILDQKIMMADSSKPEVVIFFGSDFGFCSNYNSQVIENINKDNNSKKIIIGKKLLRFDNIAELYQTKESYDLDSSKVEDLIYRMIGNLEVSAIYVVYNRYYSVADIKLVKEKIYPIEINEKDEKTYKTDFVYEGEASDILRNMIKTYIKYQIKLSAMNTAASENILRQNTTQDSLKKIDEREDIFIKERRKERNMKQFRKILETFSKRRTYGRD